MKIKNVLSSMTYLVLPIMASAQGVSGENVPTPDISIINNDAFAPVVGVAGQILGVLTWVVLVGGVGFGLWYSYQLIAAGDDLISRQNAKTGLKQTIIGLTLGVSIVFIVRLVISLLNSAGIN